MPFLFVLWIFVRNLLYAALQTNVLWIPYQSIVEHPHWNWLEVYGCLCAVHTIINFPRIWLANRLRDSLYHDVALFALSVVYGLISGSILTLLLGAIIWFAKRWTGYEPDWLWLWLWTVSLITIALRADARRKAGGSGRTSRVRSKWRL
jgi:hypothetical protein